MSRTNSTSSTKSHHRSRTCAIPAQVLLVTEVQNVQCQLHYLLPHESRKQYQLQYILPQKYNMCTVRSTKWCWMNKLPSNHFPNYTQANHFRYRNGKDSRCKLTKMHIFIDNQFLIFLLLSCYVFKFLDTAIRQSWCGIFTRRCVLSV